MNGPAPIRDKRAGMRAWLVTEGNLRAVAEWVGGEVRPNQGIWFEVGGDELCCCEEEPLSDVAFPGDYIVETADGRMEAWIADAFERNYEVSGPETTIN